MRILIGRHGSGWGGVHSNWLHDTQNKIKINLDQCYRTTKDNKYFKTNILKTPIDEFPQECIYPCNYDLSLLESFLPDCELTNPGYAMMDQQVDIVHILLDDDSIRCVYDTRRTDIKPVNPALCAKLELLINPGNQWRH